MIATDPLPLLPDLGYEWADRLALEIVLADVAVSGVPPTYLVTNLVLSPSWTDGEPAKV